VDIAEACLAAYQAIGLDPSVSGPYNIASGQSHSIQDVIRTVEALTGHRFEIEWQEAQKGFPIYLKTDRQKAERILRWVPRHSSLENLVSSMWKAVKSEIRG
jgi:UDP-glucose 4-epimerase